MINLRDGYSPYLIRWTEQDDAASIGSEDGSTDRVYAPSMDSADSKALDDRVDVDIISCFNLSDESGLDVEDSVDEFLKQSLSETRSIGGDDEKLEEDMRSLSISKMNHSLKTLKEENTPKTKSSALTLSVADHHHLETRGDTVSMKEYRSLQNELAKWQSAATRWQSMANLQDEQSATMRRRESKYKQKIRDQQLEVMSLTKRLRQRDFDLEQNVKALKEREQEVEGLMNEYEAMISELIGYKESNEYRRKNSYCDGTLWKFSGDGMNNVKFNRAPKLKYVMFVPTKRRLYHSDSVHDDAETKLVNVTYVSHQNGEIERLLPPKFRGRWIKIIGEKRIVLFAAKDKQDADRWYDTIRNSLQNFAEND